MYTSKSRKNLLLKIILIMIKETSNQKTILNVGYCETTTEWLNRIITDLADEDKNFLDFSVICS